jgi:hypothetical protein
MMMEPKAHSQIIEDRCEYSHTSIFNSYEDFEAGNYASTIPSNGEFVKLQSDLKQIELNGKRYSLSNPEYLPMPSMPAIEQILFDSESALVIGITLNNGYVTFTVLNEINNGKLMQSSYTLANKQNSFSNIKEIISGKREVKSYKNPTYHFSFNYSPELRKLSSTELNDINNLQHNKQLGTTYESGFENQKTNIPPLILIYVLKKQKPSDFYKLIEKYTYDKIDVSNAISSINDKRRLVNSASFEKPVVDLENKIIMFTGEMELNIWPFSSKGKGMFVQFFGKEKVIQVNFATTVDNFDNDFVNFFLPIISSFEFDNGYQFIDLPSSLMGNTNVSNPIVDFMNGYSEKFECNGAGKGLGLKFSMKYPQNWKSEEGNRPHIVRKLSNEDFSLSAMFIVNDLEYYPTENEINEFFSEDIAREMIPNGGKYLKSNTTTIDGERAMVLDYAVNRERLGNVVKGRVRMYSIIYKNYLLQIQFLVGQNPIEDPVDLNQVFTENEILFNAMINSLVITSKWEN